MKLRPGRPEDAEACGRICFEAFGALAARHSFVADFPAPEAGIGLVRMGLGHAGFYSVVAEAAGRIVGSNASSRTSHEPANSHCSHVHRLVRGIAGR
jgi:hypothetical protein